MSYTPSFERPYPNGWENAEVEETTPISAQVLDKYDDAILGIEEYLSDGGLYEFPAGGIPENDLSAAVRQKLNEGGGSGTSDYSDLDNKPSINGVTLEGNKTTSDLHIPVVTESTVSEWGYTKNTGTYSKPAGGIPEEDLSEDVQEKLNSSAYELPVASDTVLGGVKVGENLTIESDGTLNAQAGGTEVVNKTWDEYKDLPEPVKNNGDIYNITDSPETLAKPYDEEKEGGYRAGEYCQHDLGFYRCVKPTSGTWDASAWEITDVGEELYSIKRGGVMRGIWDYAVSGEDIELDGTTHNPLNALMVYGKSAQAVDPEHPISPDYPQPIDVAGWVCTGRQLLDVNLDALKANNPSWTWNGNIATKNGVSVTCYEDGTFKVNGTSTAEVNFAVVGTRIFSGGKYHLSGNPSTSCRLQFYDGTWTNVITDQGNGGSLTLDADAYMTVRINIPNGATASNLLFRPMLQHTSTAPGWKPAKFEPFGSGVNELNVNLDALKALNASWTWNGNIATKNGVSVTCFEDGTFKVNGTASADTLFPLAEISGIANGKNYYLKGGLSSSVNVSVTDNSTRQYTDTGSGVAFSYSNGRTLNFRIAFSANTVLDNLIKPMLTRPAFSHFPYSPYREDGGNVKKYNVVEDAIYGNVPITNVKGFMGSSDGHVNIDGDSESVYFRCVAGVKYYWTCEANTDRDRMAIYSEIPKQNLSPITQVFTIPKNTVFEAPVDGYCMILVKTSVDTEVAESVKVIGVTQSLRIPTPTGLPAIPLPDNATDYTYIAGGKKWLADEWEYDGEKVWRWEKVGKTMFTSSSAWSRNTAGKYFTSEDFGKYAKGEWYPVVCDVLPWTDNPSNGGIFVNLNGNIRVNYMADPDTADGIKDLMNGAIMYGILAAPIRTEVTDPEIIEAVKSICTNTGYTRIVAGDYNGMVCTQDVDYYIDNRTAPQKRADCRELESRIKDLESAFAALGTV